MPGRGEDVVMRPSGWAVVLVGVLTWLVAYQLTNWPRFPNQSTGLSDEPKSHPLVQKPVQPLIDKDEARLPDTDSSSAVLQPDPSPAAQNHAPPEDPAGTGASELASASPINQDLSYLAYDAYSELPPEPKPADTVLSALKSIPPGTPIDERNNLCLLQALREQALDKIANRNPSARYHCVLAAARDGKILATGDGTVEGEILSTPRGTHGFGYDPLFYLPEQNKTMAELDIKTKLTFSHRGRAFAALLAPLFPLLQLPQIQ